MILCTNRVSLKDPATNAYACVGENWSYINLEIERRGSLTKLMMYHVPISEDLTLPIPQPQLASGTTPVHGLRSYNSAEEIAGHNCALLECVTIPNATRIAHRRPMVQLRAALTAVIPTSRLSCTTPQAQWEMRITRSNVIEWD